MTHSIRAEAPPFIPTTANFYSKGTNQKFPYCGFPITSYKNVTKKLENITITEPKEPSPPSNKVTKPIAYYLDSKLPQVELKFNNIELIKEKFERLILDKVNKNLQTEEDNLIFSYFNQFHQITFVRIPQTTTATDLAKKVTSIINDVYDKISEPKEVFPNFSKLSKTKVLPLFLSIIVQSDFKVVIKSIQIN